MAHHPNEPTLTHSTDTVGLKYNGMELQNVLHKSEQRITALELALEEAGKVKPEWIEELFEEVTTSKKLTSEVNLLKKNLKATQEKLKATEALVKEQASTREVAAVAEATTASLMGGAAAAQFTDFETRVASIEKFIVSKEGGESGEVRVGGSAPSADAVGVVTDVAGVAGAPAGVSAGAPAGVSAGSAAGTDGTGDEGGAADVDAADLIKEHTGWHFSIEGIQKVVLQVVQAQMGTLLAATRAAEEAGTKAAAELAGLHDILQAEKDDQKAIDAMQMAEVRAEDDLLKADISNVRREMQSRISIDDWMKTQTATQSRFSELRAEFEEKHVFLTHTMEKKFQEEVLGLYNEQQAAAAKVTNRINGVKAVMDDALGKINTFLNAKQEDGEDEKEQLRKASVLLEGYGKHIDSLEKSGAAAEARIAALEEAAAEAAAALEGQGGAASSDMVNDLAASLAELREAFDADHVEHGGMLISHGAKLGEHAGTLATHAAHVEVAEAGLVTLADHEVRIVEVERWRPKTSAGLALDLIEPGPGR